MARSRSAKAIALARAALDERGIGEPRAIDIELIAADHGVAIARRAMDNAEGRLLRAGARGVACIDHRAFDTQKWRFVAAHELGHFALHADRDHFDACFDTAPDRDAKTRAYFQEAEASDYATELLMPSCMFAPRCQGSPPTFAALTAIADEFRMSLTAVAVRWIELCDAKAAIVHVVDGVVEFCARTDAFGRGWKRGAAFTGVRANETMSLGPYGALVIVREPRGPRATRARAARAEPSGPMG